MQHEVKLANQHYMVTITVLRVPQLQLSGTYVHTVSPRPPLRSFMVPIPLRLNAGVKRVGGLQSNMVCDRNLTCGE